MITGFGIIIENFFQMFIFLIFFLIIILLMCLVGYLTPDDIIKSTLNPPNIVKNSFPLIAKMNFYFGLFLILLGFIFLGIDLILLQNADNRGYSLIGLGLSLWAFYLAAIQISHNSDFINELHQKIDSLKSDIQKNNLKFDELSYHQILGSKNQKIKKALFISRYQVCCGGVLSIIGLALFVIQNTPIRNGNFSAMVVISVGITMMMFSYNIERIAINQIVRLQIFRNLARISYTT